jgi:NADPH:quinone reductase
MKAIVLSSIGSEGTFSLQELPVPPVRVGEVRIRVKAVSFNPVDCQIRRGHTAGRGVASMVLGRDLSGTIDAVHPSVDAFRIGDDVYSYVCTLASSGTYAEYVSVPAELVAMKPAGLTHEQAAAVPVAGITASMALDKTGACGTTSVFVAGGAGGVGTFALMIARQRGVRRLMTTAGSAASRAHLIERCGLEEDQVIDYRQPDFVGQALRRNAGEFDVVVDLLGGRMLSACCALLALDGRLASVTEAPTQQDFDRLFDKNASFHAVGANAYSLTDDRRAWRRYRAWLDGLSQAFVRGDFPAPPLQVLGTLSPEVVDLAHALLERSSVQGKLVMRC